MAAVPHPIPYQGSKRHLAQAIIRYFPEDVDCLIEPFAGSAAISLATAGMGKAKRFLLNDINAPLIALWQSIVHEPDVLADRYESLWNAQQGRERSFYDSVRLRFNKTHRPYYFLYLLARCVKASIRYNANGEFNQSPDNRRKGRHFQTMRQDILAASKLLHNRVTFMSTDYRKALKSATPQDMVYLDPPYQGVYANRDPRYIEGVVFEDFVDALASLNHRNIPFIVSYDGRTGSKVYGRLLPDALNLERVELNAGRSSQLTLLGKSEDTFESLYLSQALVARIGKPDHTTELLSSEIEQLSLFSQLA